jgi:hypothetical protein
VKNSSSKYESSSDDGKWVAIVFGDRIGRQSSGRVVIDFTPHRISMQFP